MPGLFIKLLSCAAFAFAYAGAVIWILERRDKKYRLGSTSFMDAFPAGAAVVLAVFLSTLLLLLKNPKAAALYAALLAAGLAFFILRREAAYRSRAKNKR